MPAAPRIKLFVSHATEDKAGFVDDLVASLEPEYEVWYDKKSITLGDSLFRAISAGIRECDYGVVVLSKAFFGKHWTQAEIDGLTALESVTRKVILPIWKDVTFEEVRDFSLILAGRFAVKSSEGLEQIVEAIRGGAQANKTIKAFNDPSKLIERFANAAAKTKEEAYSADTLTRESGIQYMKQAFYQIFEDVLRSLEEVRQKTGWKIEERTWSAHLETPRLFLQIEKSLMAEVYANDYAVNSVASCSMRIVLAKPTFDQMGQFNGRSVIVTHDFKPFIKTDRSLRWIGRNTVLENNEVPGYMLDMVLKRIEEKGL